MVYKIDAEQFIYPVADFDNGNQLMLLYQKSLENIELWMWDTSNHHAIKGLSSFNTPVNLRMMPSGQGFSFIDEGYIKIKEFVKRSPRTLPIYEPIGLFSSMNWIDDETFYFVAREGDFFQIFQSDLQAQVQRLTHAPADALYPQKIDSQLFYMKRNMNGHVSIVSQPWNPVAMHENPLTETSMIKKSCQQLCFLNMKSEHEGFYLQAPTKKVQGLQQNCYEFACYHLTQNHEKQWMTTKLFTFKIPAKYIIGAARLYESLEPFLPNYCKNEYVYFMNWHEELQQFEMQELHIPTMTVKIMNDQNVYRNINEQFFAPYISNEKIYCGFIVQDQRNPNRFQNIFTTENVQFDLPYFE